MKNVTEKGGELKSLIGFYSANKVNSYNRGDKRAGGGGAEKISKESTEEVKTEE